MNYKISIILPIYNVERYLKSALDSIINQTIGVENLEVIMVDDCSDDGSRYIVQDYAERYENFIGIYLNQNSGGAGKPRNIGLKNVTSDYILFLDPDDELMPNCCEDLYKELVDKNADIVTGNALCVFKNETLLDLNYNEKFYEIVPNKNLELFKPFRVWGTLFKKSLIFDNELNFINVPTNEDTYFVYSCFFKANKIIYLNDYIGVKHYERGLDEHISLTHNFNYGHIIGTIDAFEKILFLIHESDPIKDYEYDPFLLNIYVRFNNKWDASFEEKKEIFNKILEYESYSNYKFILPIHFKIMDFLLNKRLFFLLSVIQHIFSSILQSKLCTSLLIKFKKNTKVG